MEEEIDLRPYLEAFIHRWKWIAAATLICTLVAVAMVSRIPPSYRATTLVAITNAREVVQFDSRIRDIDEGGSFRVYPELAVSDELLQNVLLQIRPLFENIESLEQLRGMTTAESGEDFSLLRLSVQSPNREMSAQIANIWAEQFVLWANEIYSNQDSRQVLFFEEQLEEADQALELTEGALIEFQARNQATIISNTLGFYHQTHSNYLRTQQTTDALLSDVMRLRTHLTTQSNTSSVTFVDQLTSLILQLQSLNVGEEALSLLPITFQISETTSLIGQSRDEQIAFLDSLVDVLEEKSRRTDEQLVELEPRILALQEEMQALEIEAERLNRAQKLAKNTYTALAYKVEEERITLQDTSTQIRLASKAAVPLNPTSSRKLLIVVVGMIVGLFIGFCTVVVLELRRSR